MVSRLNILNAHAQLAIKLDTPTSAARGKALDSQAVTVAGELFACNSDGLQV